MGQDTIKNQVRFISDPSYYEAERDGEKCCTVRIVEKRDLDVMLDVDSIRIESGTTGLYFTRALTWCGVVGELLGKALVVYCWHPDDRGQS